MNNAVIKEIFSSIQGEALYVGEKQLFVRFCGCNLNCEYCDTDFEKDNEIKIFGINKSAKNPINAEELKNIIKSFPGQTISLTGGEPLLYADFLRNFLPLIKEYKIYLETNGSLPEEFKKVVDFVDVISMDIKLYCSTKQTNQFEKNEKFIKIAKALNKEIFVKVVINNEYDKNELSEAINLAKKYDIPFIIQPMDCKNKSKEFNKNSIIEVVNFAANKYKNVRFIPQLHKFLDLQ